MRYRLAAVAAAAALALTLGAASPGHHVAQRRDHSGNLNNSSCQNETVGYAFAVNASWARIYWTANGCGWWVRMHVHCGIPSRGIDDGWHNGGWVTALQPTVSDVHCDSGDFIFKAYIQWKHHTGTTIYARDVSSQIG